MSHDFAADEDTGLLAELVETLHVTFQRIRQLTGENADVIVHPASGTTYLLPGAQHELLLLESLERQHSAELTSILDAIPAQVALLDQDGRIIAFNEAWRRFAELHAFAETSHALGRNYLDVCQSAEGLYADHGQDVAAGIRRVLAAEDRHYMLEFPCHLPSEECWFLLTVTPVDGGNNPGAVVMHVDISARYVAHAQTEDLQKRLERLIDQAKVGILVHRNFVPILVNRELASIFGYENPEEIVAGGDFLHLYADDEHDRVIRYNRERLSGAGAPGLYQVKGRRRDGAPIILESRAFTIEWGGQMAVCAMLSDVTAQVATEEQLRQSQRLEAVGLLTGGVAHDFNNLLTVILGNAELLAESLSHDSRLKSLADVTANAAERGAELTAQLLAFARRQPLDPRPCDSNRQIAGMLPLLRRTLGEQVELEMISAADPWKVMIDPGQLESAILNLCINARDAMPKGGRLTIETANVHLDSTSVTAYAEMEPGHYVMVAVSDTGIGMDGTTLARVFEPFFTTKEVGKGSGLGLSMVYGFIKQSRGHIKISSEPGKGTTVTLYLRCADEEIVPSEETLDPPRLVGGPEHILVVEDDNVVRAHLCNQLKGLGYEVTSAVNGPQALAILERVDGIDLLFTDVVMPGGMNGRQLADAARVLRENLKVLFTSGYSENAIVHDGRLDPGIHLLGKPYRRRDMAIKVRAVLDAPP